MRNSGSVTASIPASDLSRARAFYADKLGLIPTQEFDGVMLVYRTDGGTAFSIYATEFAGQAGHTIAQWHVDDIELVHPSIALAQIDSHVSELISTLK